MQRPFIHWIRIAGIVIVSGMLLFPPLGWAESLKDGVISKQLKRFRLNTRRGI